MRQARGDKVEYFPERQIQVRGRLEIDVDKSCFSWGRRLIEQDHGHKPELLTITPAGWLVMSSVRPHAAG